MSALIRTVAIALIAGLLTLCTFGLRLACSPGDYQLFLREGRRQEELRKLQRATWHREDCQQQAVQEWIVRRCTLAAVLQRLQELDWEIGQQWPPYHTATLDPNKSPDFDEERHYRTVHMYVEMTLHGRPEVLAPALRRLEQDYKQFQADRQTFSTVASERKGGVEREKKGGR